MFINCPVDLISNHPFGQPPNRAVFLAAEAKPVRVWIQEAFLALELSNPATIDEYRTFMLCSGEDRLATYLQNLCYNTQLMHDCIATTFGRPGLFYESLEAEFLLKTIKEHDVAAFQRRLSAIA